MTTTAGDVVSQLRAMDDFLLLKFFKWYTNEVVQALDLDRDCLLSGVGSLRDDPRLAAAFELLEGRERAALSRKEAVTVARFTLEALAVHPNFRESLERELANYEDDEMPADIVLSLGFAAVAVILASTTKFRIVYKNGKLSVEVGKEPANPEMLKRIVEPLAGAARVLSQGAANPTPE